MGNFDHLKTEINDDLQLMQDEGFQKKEWILDRIIFFLLAGFILCGALGVFGRGILSYRHFTTGSGTLVNYSKWMRYQTAEDLTLQFTQSNTEYCWVEVDDVSLDQLGISVRNPQPMNVISKDGYKRFIFQHSPQQKFKINLEIKPGAAFGQDATLRTSAGDSFTLHTFIYP